MLPAWDIKMLEAELEKLKQEREVKDNEAITRLAEYEDSGLSPEEVQELAKAKADGRLVVLPCKVWELLQKYKELTEPQGDEAETYTTGYRNGHRNGQAELIAYLLQIDTGTREAAEKALERKQTDGCGEKE